MVTINKALKANTGIYTVPEAALYARLPTQTLQRWLTESAQSASVVKRAEVIEEGKFISFLDFIQSLAIRAIRMDHKIPLQRIRDAVKTAQDCYGVKYPFAKKHTTFLFGKEVLIKIDGQVDPVQVSGRFKHQQMMHKIIELYLNELSWDSDGIAKEYRPFDIGILLNPHKRFGEPIVESCGISAVALWEACQTEGSFEAAADAYGVEIKDVKAASRFFDILEGKPRG